MTQLKLRHASLHPIDKNSSMGYVSWLMHIEWSLNKWYVPYNDPPNTNQNNYKLFTLKLLQYNYQISMLVIEEGYQK